MFPQMSAFHNKIPRTRHLKLRFAEPSQVLRSTYVGVEKSMHDAPRGYHSETRPTFLHVSERWIAEAVRTERVALATGPRRPQHQLKVVQGTAELLVQFDGAVLRKTVGLITVGAMKPAGFRLQIHFSVKHCFKLE